MGGGGWGVVMVQGLYSINILNTATIAMYMGDDSIQEVGGGSDRGGGRVVIQYQCGTDIYGGRFNVRGGLKGGGWGMQ